MGKDDGRQIIGGDVLAQQNAYGTETIAKYKVIHAEKEGDRWYIEAEPLPQ